jgi:hypothetical protein
VPVVLVTFYESWSFSIDFGKTFKYQISLKSFQWKPSFTMRTDRRTGIKKPIVPFRNFAKAPKNRFHKIISDTKLVPFDTKSKYLLIYLRNFRRLFVRSCVSLHSSRLWRSCCMCTSAIGRNLVVLGYTWASTDIYSCFEAAKCQRSRTEPESLGQ